MAKAMIISVGTGTGPDVNIVNPLVKTVKDTEPAQVSFLVSTESRAFAEEVARQSGLHEGNFFCTLVRNHDDIHECFQAALQALHELRNKGYKPEDIIADFTSGTKAMTAGLSLAAVSFRCAKLKYIYGVRRNGRVENGTEKFLSVPPAAILAVSDLHLARELILQLRFEAAQEILPRINDVLLVPQDKNLRENLQLLAGAYARWDHFDHITFCGEYNKVKWQNPELHPFKVKDKLPERRLIPLAKELEKGNITLDALADLYNNAQRREREGKFDDAVARLYRLTEMIAQHVLSSQFGIRTSDVQLDNEKLATLDPSARNRLAEHRNASDEKIKIGLEMSYWLLHKLNHPLGQAFISNSKLRGLLKDRNESILAHGTKPVSREVYTSLKEQVMRLAKKVDPEFERRAQELQFPWLIGEEGT